MPGRGRRFTPGTSGNPAGRPKGSKDRLPRTGSPAAKSVKHAWARVTDADPALLDRAIKRGLESTNSSARLGYLELGAKLNKEIAPQTETAGEVRVIMVGHGAAVMEAWRAEAARIAALSEGSLDELEPTPPPDAASPEVRRRGDQGLVPRPRGSWTPDP